MNTKIESLYDKHWNADQDAKTHGDVCDNHVNISIQYAIDVLTDVACFASLKEDADIIHNKISELQSLLKPKP